MTDGPKLHRRHGFYALVMVIGWVLPPIAVLLRFGFGSDFFLNILLTLCGYIPGKRTPTWASRAGLVKDPTVKKKVKTQWANRYDERTPTRADGYQDEDDQTTSNNHSKQHQAPLIEQHLLEPESLVESSSTNSVERRSIDSLRRQVNNPSTRSILSSSKQPNFDRNHHGSLTSLKPSPSPTRDRNSTPSNSNKLNRDLSKKHSSRRKTFDPLATDLDNSVNQDDPYFIRRASTIHLSSSSNHKNQDHNRKSTIHSPTSVKSFPSKLGFGSRHHSLNPKDRIKHDSSQEGAGWEENPPRSSLSHSPTTTSTHPTQTNSLNHLGHNDDDGLNHQF